MTPVVICAFNRLDLTQACVESIRATTEDYEIVVVDNNSTDRTRDWLYAQGIKTVWSSENLGWGHGANVGTAATNAAFVAHLNNDTLLTPGWLDRLREPFATNPDLGMTSARLTNPDGSLQHAGIRLFFDDNAVLTAANITEEQAAGEVQVASMAACLVRMDAWLSVGGLDPSFWNGYEDVDFCLRLQLAGWKVRYVPEATVIHEAHASGPERWAHVNDNIRLLHERWADRLQAV